MPDLTLPDPTLPENRPAARARRTVLTIAAAAAVVLLPTACDYAVANTGSGGYGAPAPSAPAGGGHAGHGGVTTELETVPAGVTEPLDPSDEPDAEPGAAEPGAAEPGAAEPGAAEEGAEEGAAEETTTTTTTTESAAPPVVAPPAAGGLEVLGTDCTNSDLAAHTGFQESPRCVATAFGEVAAAALSPSLLITDAPDTVAADQPFDLVVSTRNLVRDRFLGAAAGGYYRESSFLNGDGVQRGHFHTACRILPSTTVAPDSEPAPAFFLATQDNGGGAGADSVTVPVTGLPAGTAQCAVWAGDGSHRVPMMTRANQTPAFDVVRITVE
ncbi:hypothetical protein ACVGOW_15065 [Pseudonocardia saturnea]